MDHAMGNPRVAEPINLNAGMTLGCHGGVCCVRGHGERCGTSWDLAPQEHHMGIILAPGDDPGGPWKQQDGHEVVQNRLFIDFGVMLGSCFEIFSEAWLTNKSGLFPGRFFIDF